MVGVEFKGRLGNQFFQYTFLKYLKTRRKGLIYFFPNPHHAYLAKYFKLPGLDNFLLESKVYSAITRIIPAILGLKDLNFHNWVAPKPVDVKNWVYYKGYYQTAYYYEQLPHKIPFELKDKFKLDFESKYGQLFKENQTVVVHIRRTDYMNYGERRKRDISLPLDYFKKCLANIKDLDSYKVIFVSDDVEKVKEVFPQQPNYIFSNNSEIIDFQIIQNADISIISNSTFAWWAAYLSPKNNTVYAPKYWFGFNLGREHPKGIMTEKFIWCDVKS
ncbi:alpha-1,2-fucosyltransferase [Pedobacter cryophilus]|uniref:Alpha-1,2-fucosyltransferase n=1 Tax=Pedobacter cryophilus TaxID=2571271 RepID=A0A4U1BYR4_9SPHI|nr:alpha-1,2-fucosyltransferase [Pedobacter cryophilus]TKB97895.1 alpha-1,2-fucosyltransferase [Pedobacter cryophilus]